MRALLFLTLLCGASRSAMAAAVLSIEPVASTAIAGSSVELTVEVTGITDLYAWQFDVDFSPDVLSAQSEIEDTFLATGGATIFIPGIVDNVNGAITDTADTLETAVSGVGGSGTLLDLDFLASGIGVSDVSLANVILLDSDFNNIPFTTSDGSVTVTPEPACWPLLPMALAVALRRRLR